ncbi:MAG: DNA gyrase inhibitor YacG [Gammaproteobacteria bacterium]|nr:MAG: DNA gyrase inhibitor YacG [Gammaproteobacteria bacterium]
MTVKKIGIVSCPNCEKKVTWDESSEYRPFCSERCKLIDLGEWADERHAIPGDEIASIDTLSEFDG